MSTIKVLMVRPQEKPQMKEVESTQQIEQDIGGSVEIKTPFDEKNVVMICNADAEVKRQTMNRALFSDKKLRNITEIISGTFIIAGIDDGGEFVSLTEQQIEKFFARFQKGEEFLFDEDGNVRVVRFDIKDVPDDTSQ